MAMDFAKMRKEMVERQIAWRGVKDPATLKAFLNVPREVFVSDQLKPYAYDDNPLPIGEGQTISQPYIVALMAQAAELNSQASVLEIGTGSGYSAAILAQMAKEVYTIERIANLGEEAKQKFNALGYKNIHVKIANGTLGWADAAPFDAIVVTAGAPVVPESLIRQLKPAGRMIIPVGDSLSQQLLRLRKVSEDDYTQEILEFVRFVPLIGQEGWEE